MPSRLALVSALLVPLLGLTVTMANFLVENVQNALKLHQAGDVSGALSLYEQSLAEKDSLTANIVSTLASNAGSIYMTYGEYEKAASKFELAIEATPEKVESHYNYAIVLNSKLLDNGKAMKHCMKAMKLDPNFYKAYHLMGNILQDMGRPEKADTYFVKAENIALSLGVEDASLVRPKSEKGFSLDSIWMFQNPEVNKSYEIPVPSSQREKIGKAFITVTCLSKKPLLFEIPQLLSPEECSHIKAAAAPKLELSHVMGSKVNADVKDDLTDTDPYRSSYNAWLPLDPVLTSLQERIALVTSLPLQYISLKSEELQVVKYESGGQFKMHHDSSAFNPRLLTALVYLQGESSHVDENGEESGTIALKDDGECTNVGGATLFPYANTDQSPNNDRLTWSVDDALGYLSQQTYEDLEKEGIAVRPLQGKAIIFFNHDSEGVIDPLAVHSGSKVFSGTKWVANYWIKMDMKALNDIPSSSTAL